MERDVFWKNFNLGTELSISGAFIYNGLEAFNDLENFYYEDDIFEFLYYISVGIERLQKIVVILIEHNQIDDQAAFEKSLITHNHLELLKRIRNKHQLNLGKSHNSFLQLLGNFYKSMRYDRFTLQDGRYYAKEKIALQEFLSNELGIKFEDNSSLFQTPNTDRIKKFIGKIVGKITQELYDIVYTEAHEQNIYTYEVRHNTKAFKIFLSKEYDFNKEEILWKEVLIFLLNNYGNDQALVDFIKNIEPLDFDPALTKELLLCFQSNLQRLHHLDELEGLYDELPNTKKNERLKMLAVIGNPNIYFEDEVNDEEF